MSVPESTDSRPLSDLSSLRRDALAAIATLGDPHGLGIKTYLEDAYGVDEVNHGTLYPALDDLVELGLIEKDKRDDRTNEYTLTARGRRELAAHRAWFATEGER